MQKIQNWKERKYSDVITVAGYSQCAHVACKGYQKRDKQVG